MATSTVTGHELRDGRTAQQRLARKAGPEGSFMGRGAGLDECPMHDHHQDAPNRREYTEVLPD